MSVRGDRSHWLVRPQANAHAALRLYCFPFAGGSAGAFRAWAGALAPAVEVCAVQPPGRERRIMEPAFTDLDALSEAAAAAIAADLAADAVRREGTGPDKRFAIFGHSMGALVGYEVSRRLSRDYELEPARLIVSGHNAPQLPDPEPPIHHLERDAFIEGVQRFGGLPPEVLASEELVELVLPTLRADFTACERYVHRDEGRLTCTLCVYGGLADQWLDRDSLEAWSVNTSGDTLVRMFQGDHFYIDTRRGELLQVLARDLSPVARGPSEAFGDPGPPGARWP